MVNISIIWSFKLGVEASMWNNKGSTLIESLFAFEIFISILILFVSLFSVLYEKEIIVNEKYQYLLEKEGDFTYTADYTEIIEKVLH